MAQIGYNVRFGSRLFGNLRLSWKLGHEKKDDGVSFNRFLNECMEEWWTLEGHDRLKGMIGAKGMEAMKGGEKLHIRGEGKVGDVRKDEVL